MRPEELEEPEGMEEQEYPEGFKEVFDTQYKRVLDYAKILFGDAPGTVSGRTEDAAQETFLVLLCNWEKFCASPNPEGWLTFVCRNVCRNLKREDQKWTRNLRWVVHQPVQGDPNGISTLVELEGLIPPEDMRLLERIYLEGCSHKEVAGELGLTASGLSMKLSRIKAAFRKKYKEFL